MFWGYSLAYSRTANKFIGDLANFGMKNVMAAPSPGSAVIPEIVFCLYQMLFCACTVQIVIGGSFERGRIVPSLVFAFIWATVVYCPIACWTWNSNGWLFQLPSLDFAGGGPVHISSGWSALGICLGSWKAQAPRREVTRQGAQHYTCFPGYCSYLVRLVRLQRWLGADASVRAMLAAFNTNTAAGCGILGWVLVDFIRTKGKFSVVGACSGAIAGLVGITPAAGFVSVWLLLSLAS